jgi:hypothetical protein
VSRGCGDIAMGSRNLNISQSCYKINCRRTSIDLNYSSPVPRRGWEAYECEDVRHHFDGKIRERVGVDVDMVDLEVERLVMLVVLQVYGGVGLWSESALGSIIET